MRAAVLEYLATSSMAIVSPRMPAPAPPMSVGMHSPSRPASRNTSKMSWGYSPVSSISRARGLTLSWAIRRHVSCSACNSSDSSKSMSSDRTGRLQLPDHLELADPRVRFVRHGGPGGLEALGLVEAAGEVVALHHPEPETIGARVQRPLGHRVDQGIGHAD